VDQSSLHLPPAVMLSLPEYCPNGSYIVSYDAAYSDTSVTGLPRLHNLTPVDSNLYSHM
jgi:hypothetical protein